MATYANFPNFLGVEIIDPTLTINWLSINNLDLTNKKFSISVLLETADTKIRSVTFNELNYTYLSTLENDIESIVNARLLTYLI